MSGCGMGIRCCVKIFWGWLGIIGGGENGWGGIVWGEIGIVRLLDCMGWMGWRSGWVRNK